MRQITNLLVLMLFPVYLGAASVFSGSLAEENLHTFSDTEVDGFNIALKSSFSFDKKLVMQQGKTYNALITNESRFDLGYRFNPYLDIALGLPIYGDRIRREESTYNALKAGDLESTIKLTFWGSKAEKQAFIPGITLITSFPTGSKLESTIPRYFLYDGNPTYAYTQNCVVLNPVATASLDFRNLSQEANFLYNLSLGGRFTTADMMKHGLTISTGFKWFVSENLNILTSFSTMGDREILDGHFTVGKMPTYIKSGIEVQTKQKSLLGINCFWGIGKENYSHYASPEYEFPQSDLRSSASFGMSFTYSWRGIGAREKVPVDYDIDDDLIADTLDKCPNEPEDRDFFQDEDGCPELDNDNDGIVDTLDKCPLKAEDKDSYQDEDGCPEHDIDGDSILDSLDKCPELAEDKDGFEDTDGCPELDNDVDGVLDSLDKCPMEGEDFDGFQDEDGCPDVDNDGDGIKDIQDMCPNRKETSKNGYKDGCPDNALNPWAKSKGDTVEVKILHGVKFASGSPRMTDRSQMYIEPLLNKLKKYTKFSVIINGYTDSAGNYEGNLNLSKKRAESVKKFLTDNDIDAKRIKVFGYGPNKPVADNRTASGRAKNRRIEIVITK